MTDARDIDGSVPISVLGMAALDTAKSGLALAVRFGTVAALATRTGRIAWVNRMQWDTCQSSFIGEELTQLSKRP